MLIMNNEMEVNVSTPPKDSW